MHFFKPRPSSRRFLATDRFLFWDSLCFGCQKRMPDKCVVFGSNRPSKEKGISNFVLRDKWQGEAQKKKEVSRLRKTKACWLETHEVLGDVFETRTRWRLLCYVFWFDYVWFWKKVSEGWYWNFDPRNLYFYGKETSRKQAKREEGEKVCIFVLWPVFDRAAFVFGREHVSFTYFVFVSEFL